ncbi:MAG: hypothetical protein DSO07_10080 [Thermoproteota archaeon]|jgi:hypothetical protein|uniref:Uncharacterized protein n=1 Tax=Candidatus Methanodesulfokora washburnensis TaxID=2478471 RepID=A0A3R9RS99_9CREN|nr:hypothetical protein [Candidatus Methanodesulfokores washburnensis]RSN77420.1 hypothetical protein D6D85_02725 [Candidatus Methanodesulfokores washburnensis]TDA39771.1 MAG: hypothetical protein DSO07_10080 [Candidatus Korarchaeota archaeon]
MQDFLDILKMLPHPEGLISYLIGSFIFLAFFTWLKMVPDIKKREDWLRDRLMKGRPPLQTKLGTFYTYSVWMRERRGYKYWLRKLLSLKAEGETEIRMHATTLYSSVRDQLPEFKRNVEEKFKVKVDFWESENGELEMSLKIPSVDMDECTEVWQGIGGILKQEETKPTSTFLDYALTIPHIRRMFYHLARRRAKKGEKAKTP